MSTPNDGGQDFIRKSPKLTLDRDRRKLLGVCAGFARYLEVPASLVRVIYVIACIVSPVLLIVYFVLYWLLEDEERPARIKEAISGRRRPKNNTGTDDQPDMTQDADMGTTASTQGTTGFDSSGASFNLRKPLYRSRKDVKIGGVCAGIADYLGVSTFIVRVITLLSLFILGGITFWGYIIFWIVLDKEPKAGKKKATTRMDGSQSVHTASCEDLQACADELRATENRLRDVEAFMTSKQFRLHCEINRI